MEGVPAVYLGRLVSKENFRAFVYAIDGGQRLVESWEEFEQHMETGLWFSTKEDALRRIPVEKPKRSRRVEVKKGEPIELIEQPKDVEILESSVELVDEVVTVDDDFLPKDD